MEEKSSAICGEQLASLLSPQPPAPKVLLLDLRSFVTFNQSRLVSSINVCIPSALLKRKNFSLECIESTISCAESRELFRSRGNCLIVLYDADSDTPKKNGTLSFLYQKLADEGVARGVRFLQGGFNSFAEQFPHLCLGARTSAPSSPSSHPSSSSLHPSRAFTAPVSGIFHFPLLAPLPSINPESDPRAIQICDHIFLGGQAAAWSQETLEKNNITYILNAAKECSDAFTDNPNIKYLRLNLLDCASQTLDLPLFSRAFDFIDEALSEGKNILIHCRAGQSRSATVVISYIMRSYSWHLQKAYRFVQAKRPSVSPNLGFIGQLIQFEKVLFGQTTNIQTLLYPEPLLKPITPPVKREVVSMFEIHVGSN